MVESSLSDVPSQPNSVDKMLTVELDENATAEQKQEAINTRMDSLFDDLEKGLINPDSREDALGQLQEVCSGLDSFTFKDQSGNDVEASFQKQDYINMNKRVVGMATNVFKSDMERLKLNQKEQEQNQKAGPQQKQQAKKKANPDEEPNIYLALIEAIMAIFKLIAKILGAADKLEESMNAKFANMQPLSFKGDFLKIFKSQASALSPEMVQQILDREDIDPSIAEAMKQEQDLSAMANDSAEPAIDQPEEPSEALDTAPEQEPTLAEEAPAPEEITPEEPEVLAQEEMSSVAPEDIQPALDEPENEPAETLMAATPEEQAPALEGAAPAEPAAMSVEQAPAAPEEGAGNEIAVEPEAAGPAQADVQMEVPAVAVVLATAATTFSAFKSNGDMTGKKKQTPKQINTAKIKKILSPKTRATTLAFIENHRQDHQGPILKQVQTLKFA